MEKLRVGVVGVGYLGTFHAEKYAAMDGVELIGVVDIDRQRARESADLYGCHAFLDHKDLMGKVDAVSIVVPTPDHFNVSRDFLENDIHVMIEKPMTETLEEADTLLELAADRNLVVQVGHLERFNPAVRALREIVKFPRFIESHRLSIYKTRCDDVSVVLDLMIHDIDIILNIVQSDIQHIHGAGISVVSGQVDIANARLAFTNGCVANVTASRISMKNERKIRLFQKDAYISVDFANHEITVVRPKAYECVDDVVSVDAGVTSDPDAGPELIPGMDIDRRHFEKGDALAEELSSFTDSVISGKLPAVTGRMGRDALKIALEIMEQIRSSSGDFLDG